MDRHDQTGEHVERPRAAQDAGLVNAEWQAIHCADRPDRVLVAQHHNACWSVAESHAQVRHPVADEHLRLRSEPFDEDGRHHGRSSRNGRVIR